MSSVSDVLRQFRPYTKGDRHRMIFGGVCAIAIAASELGTVGLFDAITDRVLAKGDLSAFWGLAGCWIAIVAVAAVAMFFSEYVTSLASERFGLRLRDDVVTHAQRQPPDFFDRRQLGDLMTRLTEDVAVIEGVACSGLLGVVTSAVSVVLFIGTAFVISWQLALVAAGVAPVFWLASHGLSGKMERAAERERQLTAKLTNAIEENLSNQSLIQAYNRETGEMRRIRAEGDSWLRAKMTETRLSAIYGPATYLVETLCVLAVFGFGAWEVARGSTTLGGLLAFATLLAYLYPAVQGLAGYRLSVSEATESVARISEILDADAPRTSASAFAGLPGFFSRGFIAFDDVSFAYPESPVPALRHMTFQARPGELVAVVGPSGSGKSTIAKLLLRFYDPAEGRVILDGADIREFPPRTLRDNITLVQQESQLLSGTIAENIAYAKRDASFREVVAAARKSGAHEFISRLPDGYQTQVGQRGRLLSGGQRQRVAIARAMLRDAPVLVLDEPTAGLSPDDSRHVMDALRPVMAGRTVIVITHDMTIAAGADRVVTVNAPDRELDKDTVIGSSEDPFGIKGLSPV